MVPLPFLRPPCQAADPFRLIFIAGSPSLNCESEVLSDQLSCSAAFRRSLPTDSSRTQLDTPPCFARRIFCGQLILQIAIQVRTVLTKAARDVERFAGDPC